MNFITRHLVNFCMPHIKNCIDEIKGTVLMPLLPSIHYAFSAVEFLSISPGKVIVKSWGLLYAEGLWDPLSGVHCQKAVSAYSTYMDSLSNSMFCLGTWDPNMGSLRYHLLALNLICELLLLCNLQKGHNLWHMACAYILLLPCLYCIGVIFLYRN